VEAAIDISAESILELFGMDEITQFTAKQLSRQLKKLAGTKSKKIE
jgi:hypothetical protein